MDPTGIFGLVALFLGPAIVLGGITSLIARAAANSRSLPPAEVTRWAKKGFWIAFMIGVALTLTAIGLCFAALSAWDTGSG